MNIKRFIVLFVAVILLMPYITAHADVVVGNRFEYEKREELEPLKRRTFCVNAPQGYVIIKDEPGSKKDMYQYINEEYPYIQTHWKNPDEYINNLITYKNGDIVNMSHTYLYKGEYWGVMQDGHSVVYPGWIPMDYLLIAYTSSDFEKENRDRFYSYTDDYDEIYSAETLVVWSWPGSDRPKRVIDNYISKDETSSIDFAYQDEEGRVWGSFTSWYYRTGGWVCLSDPENSEIPSFNPAPSPIKWSPDVEVDWTAGATLYPPADPPETPPFDMTSLPFIIAASSLAVGVVVFIWIFKKQKKAKSGEGR